MICELHTDRKLEPGQVNRDLSRLIEACPAWAHEKLWAHADQFTDDELIDGITLVAEWETE